MISVPELGEGIGKRQELEYRGNKPVVWVPRAATAQAVMFGFFFQRTNPEFDLLAYVGHDAKHIGALRKADGELVLVTTWVQPLLEEARERMTLLYTDPKYVTRASGPPEPAAGGSVIWWFSANNGAPIVADLPAPMTFDGREDALDTPLRTTVAVARWHRTRD